jgi:uncharacterized protein
MATVTIRIDDNTRDELEEIARTRGVTLSDLLRSQIDGLLGRDIELRGGEAPHTLSDQQRLLLVQQHEILAMLHAEDKDENGEEYDYEAQHHHEMAEVLREGYAGEYGNVFAGVYPEMSRSECGLVWDILDMFTYLQVSIDRLPAEDRSALGSESERWLRFGGFDLNDSREGRMLSYTQYLVDHDRWEPIKPLLEEIGDRGNSHHRRLAMYQRMLAVYTPIFDQLVKGARGYSIEDRLLALDDLRQVAEACEWPGNR